MNPRTFVDSNVFIYAFDSLEPRKQDRARTLLENPLGWVISPQVMMEFYSAVTRKMRLGLDEREAGNAVRAMSTSFDIVAPDAAIVLDAVVLSQRDGLSVWDALIVQCALVGRCARVLSEDMQHGRRFGALQIENPFHDLG